MKDYKTIAEETDFELTKNNGWIKRYAKYYDNVYPDGNKSKYVAAVIDSFHVESPLTKYLSIGRVMGSSRAVDIDLRINGHSVATFHTELTEDIRRAIDEKISTRVIRDTIRKSSVIRFSKKGLTKVAVSDESIKSQFEALANRYGDSEVEWTSKDANEFRRIIKQIETKSTHSEHTIEGQLLKRLSSNKSKGKPILSIQPIKLCKAYFQLVTPLSASKVEREDIIEYSMDKNGHDSAGGGIDILARIKNENNQPELCVIELKDKYEEKERPTVAIKQAIAYAVFIDRLIRSEEAHGPEWYKNIFGIKKKMKGTVKINAMVAMPYKDESNMLEEEDEELAETPIDLKNGDIIELHYFFFDKNHLYDDDMSATCSLKTFSIRNN